jgi:hydroxyacylglutathione hydrolase
LRYLRDDEDIYSVLDSLKRIATLELKRMFCSFSGSIDRPENAIHHKIEYLENLKDEVEKALQRGLSPREIQRRLLGRGDQFSFISSGHISKQNLINAFLKPKRG